MPLLNRVDYLLGPRLPPGLKTDESIFIVRCTGECVRTYAEYRDLHKLYSQQQWQDKYHGQSGLSYESALAIEKRVDEHLEAQFPKQLERSVVCQIHHSTLRKDELVNKIYDSLKPSKIDSDKENGSEVLSSSPRAAPPVTKRLLFLYLIYVADEHKPGVWVVKDRWAQKYSLPSDLPDGLQGLTAAPSSPAAAGTDRPAGSMTPMKSPLQGMNAANAQPAPVRTLEEEEARLKPGSLKALAFQVMKQKGPEPVSVEDIIHITTINGTKVNWADNNKKSLAQVLGSDAAFYRAARGQYTLRAFADKLPLSVLSQQGTAAPAAGSGSGLQAAKKLAADAFKPMKGAAEPAKGADQVSGLTRAEQLLQIAQRAKAAAEIDHATALQALKACKQRLADAQAHTSSKGKSPARQSASRAGAADIAVADGSQDGKAADSSSADAHSPQREPEAAEQGVVVMFALPERLRDYTGPVDDRKALTAWRHERANEQKRLARGKATYIQEQRLAEAKAARVGTEQLQQALDRAQKAAEDVAAKLRRAVKAEADAIRASERERQRELLRDVKEKAKTKRVKQKQAEKEERERRRQEALAAKRYPIDDLELLYEQLATAAAPAAFQVKQPEAAASAAGTEATAPPAAGAQHPAPTTQLLPSDQLDLIALSQAQHLNVEESQQCGQLLFVSDMLSQFSRQLSVKGCSHAELQAVLDAAGSAANKTNLDNDGDQAQPSSKQAAEAQQWLAATYTQLLKVLVDDISEVEGAVRLFWRWSAVLKHGSGSWPEMLRRWVLTQQQDNLSSPEALAAAKYLHDHEAACLTPCHHLALLAQLLDDCLDTSLVRDLLALRVDEAAELAAGVRAELAEGRKKLRELQDAEKEARKHKKAAALALAMAAAERHLREQGKLPAGGSQADPAAVAATAAAADIADGKDSEAAGGVASGAAADAKDHIVKRIKATTKEILDRVAGPGINNVALAELEAELAADMEEELPTWELPPELQEYSGPAGDKKTMSEFRRKQQEARKQLDKAKAKWQAEQAQRDKAKAERKKKEIESERRMQQERQKAEEQLAEQQEQLEQQLERYSIRRQPLGLDRFNRAYWWGLAGHKEALLVQEGKDDTKNTVQLLLEAAEAAAAGASAANTSQQVNSVSAKGSQDAAGVTDACHSQEQQQQQQPKRQDAAASLGPDQVLAPPMNHKGLLLPAGPEGWIVLDDVQQIEALIECLDKRGVREKELRGTLEKVLFSVSDAVIKAAAAREAAAAAAAAGASRKPAKKEKEQLTPRALPSRHARAAAAKQIRQQTSAVAAKAKEVAAVAKAAAAESDGESGPFCGWQLAAVKGVVHNMLELAAPAAKAKVPCPDPSDSWMCYENQLLALVHGDIPASWAQKAAAAATRLAVATAPAAGADGLISNTGMDAAWNRAMQAAAAAVRAAATAHGDDKAACTAVLGQLRLQLLGFEEQLVAATGELPCLYGCSGLGHRGSAFGEDSVDAEQPDAEDQGPSSENEAGSAAKQQNTAAQKQRSGAQSRHSSNAFGEQGKADIAADSMEVDGQQAPNISGKTQAAQGGIGAAVSSADGSRGSGRGTKRGASAIVISAIEQAGGGAADTADGTGNRTAKRRQQSSSNTASGSGAAAKAGVAGSSKGLPPRPEACARRTAGTAADPQHQQDRKTGSKATGEGRVAAAVEHDSKAEGAGGHSPGSREGSAAPVDSDVRAVAAVDSRKRGRVAAAATDAGSSRATSLEPEEQQQRGKKQAQQGGKATAVKAIKRQERDALVLITGDGGQDSISVYGDEEAGMMRQFPLHHRLQLEQGDDVSEEVTEEDDSTIPWRLKGRTVWKSGTERDSWRSTVASAATAAALSYCAAALAFHASDTLHKLAASAPAGRKDSKGK